MQKENEPRYDASRKLAAIMFVDIVGYSKMMHEDEKAAFKALNIFQDVLNEEVKKSGGHIVKSYGDGSLSLFNSAVQSLRCAHAIQQKLHESPLVSVRIGLHIGDVVEKEGDLYGDGVNIAARLESLGSAGTVFFSKNIYDKVHNHKEFEISELGQFQLKNIKEPIRVYALVNDGYPKINLNDMDIRIGKAITVSEVRKPRRLGLYIILLIALIGIGYVAINSLGTKIIDKSIAVLPFHNESNNPDTDYFCNGMMEDILTQIQNVGELKVISRSSVMPYKDTPKPIREVAKELNVAYILEGSVRKSGEQLLVTAHLVDGSDESQLWSDRFDKKLSAENIFEIQGTIAENIVTNLQAQLTAEERLVLEKKPTNNLDAYDHYLRGMYFYNDRFGGGEEYVVKALEQLEEAVKLDSSFAKAQLFIGHCHDHMYWVNIDGSEERANLARVQFNKAFDLDPNDPEIIEGQGWMQYHIEGDYKKARNVFKDLSDRFPKLSSPLNALGVINGRLGNWKESKANFEQSLSLDPKYISTHLNYFYNLYGQRKMEAAKEALENLLNVSPQNARAHEEMSNLMIRMTGDVDRSLEYMKQSGIDNPEQIRKLTIFSKDFTSILDEKPRNLESATAAELRDFALVHFYTQNPKEAKILAQQAIEKYGTYLEHAQRDFRAQMDLAKMYALIGDRLKSLNLVQEVTDRLPISKDALFGPQIEYERAKVLNILGEGDEVNQILIDLLNMPSNVTLNLLKTDPAWFNLRLSPKFLEILDGKHNIQTEIESS